MDYLEAFKGRAVEGWCKEFENLRDFLNLEKCDFVRERRESKVRICAFEIRYKKL